MEFYNTLTKRRETFRPQEAGKVRMYLCGPTTYNYIHLGNARPLVVFDTLRRFLLYKGYEVTFVQNFTDIDDKIIKRAREEGEDPIALAARYVEEYFTDADALNVRRADIHPKVSEHLDEIIDLIQRLVDKGLAYEVDGDVYYAVRRFPGYGKLSGRDLEDLLSGARVGVDQRKQDPLDFALWKAAKPGEPAWSSPWGKGRPGWHIECSAMSMKYLGETLDIHAGGADLIFPHHENEIAQSEGATGKPFSRYWIHNGFITIREEKMSKSLGNVTLVRELVATFPPGALRLFLLSTHYRSPLDFDPENVEANVRGLARLRNSISLVDEALAKRAAEVGGEYAARLSERLVDLREQFEQALEDDFNTALAIAVVFNLASEVNAYLHQEQEPDRDVLIQGRKLFDDFNGVLGIFPQDAAGRLVLEDESLGDELSEGLLELLLDIRWEARANRDFAVADEVRDSLKSLGVMIEDTPQGARWKRTGGGEEDIAPTLLDLLLSMRQKARKAKNFSLADGIRDGVKALGIILEDTPEGPRWKRL